MDPIVSAPLVVLLTTLLDGMSLYGVCCVSLGEKPAWKDGLLFVGIIFLLERAAHPFLGDGYSGFAYLMCFVLTLLQARFAFHRRGRCLWLATGISLLAQFGFVLVVGPVCLWIFGAERANAMIVSYDWGRVIQSLVNLAIAFPYAGLLYLLRRLLPRLPARLSAFLYLSRAFLLLAGVFVCAFMLFNQLTPLVDTSRLHVASTLLTIIMLLILVCLSYLIQDFRYLKMRKNNDTLERQKRITDTLISNTRQFRHNILNMIYGFEGALLNDQPEASRAYYQHLVSKCALINHENIAALHQLDHPLLEKTLLEKIQCANDRDIPFYLCVQGTLPRKAALLSRVCRAVTFLADQAINVSSASQGGIQLSLYGYADAVELCLLTGESLDTVTDRVDGCLRRLPGSVPGLCISLEQQGRYVRQTAVIH